MGLIPEDVIESIRLQSDIVEVISSHVQLKKRGKNHVGLCPFHREKTPSFTVTPDKHIFYCFGCGAGGDVFKFLMLKENVTYPEAIELMARRLGVQLPANDDPVEARRRSRAERARAVNSLARDYYLHILQHHETAAAARQYLTARGLSAEVLESFQVGFALPGWRNLLDTLTGKDYRVDELLEAGLILQSTDGNLRDLFRNRVILPICDALGRVVGFGGRVLDQSLPKYINTPETPWFNKGRILYGLHVARAAMKEKGYAVVMEGYMDVITAHQYGITNAVASLGTSLTREQGKLLLNYTRDVTIAYDADAAGVTATLRGLDILSELGCQVRVITVPDGKDPDDFIQKNGPEAWEKLATSAPSLFEYKIKQISGRKKTVTVSDKIKVMQQILPDLSNSAGEIEREENLKMLSRVLNLSWETVLGEYNRYQTNMGKKWLNPDNIAKIKHNMIDNNKKPDSRDKLEESLIRLILEKPDLGEEAAGKLSLDLFTRPFYRKVLQLCLEAAKKPVYRPADLLDRLNEEEQQHLSMLLTGEIPGDDLVHIMKSYVDAIGRMNRRDRREEILREIDDADKSGNGQRCIILLKELSILHEIGEAEKAKEGGRCARLLQEYRQFLETQKP